MDLAIRFLRAFPDGWEPKQSKGHYCVVRAANGTVLDRHWEQGKSAEQCSSCASLNNVQHNKEREGK